MVLVLWQVESGVRANQKAEHIRTKWVLEYVWLLLRKAN